MKILLFPLMIVGYFVAGVLSIVAAIAAVTIVTFMTVGNIFTRVRPVPRPQYWVEEDYQDLM